MDLKDLDDKDFKEKLENFQNSVKKVEKVLDLALNVNAYDKLSIMEKTEYDLFIAYTLNTLYWLYLRTKGTDPNNNDIKNQLNRVKDYMLKAKQAHERNTIRPTINKGVAERFIKHGINYSEKNTDDINQPPAKRIKLDD